MLHGRWCPQTSAGVWHRARPQQRPEPDDGGAPDSDACDTWVNVQGPLLHVFFLPQVKNQHATVLNHVELQRLGEAKRSQGASRKTRKTRRVSGHCSLGSIPHLKLSFLFVFLWFLACVFLVDLVIWCFLPSTFPQFHETCFIHVLALQPSLPWTFFCGTSSKYSLFSIQLVPIPQNCGHF